MASSAVVDHDLDRPQVQARRRVEPSGTNRACGLAFFRLHLKAGPPPPGASRFSLAPDHGFSAGGHGGAAIPVPIPNTEVKGSFAEGSAGPARARVGRRRLFSFPMHRASAVPGLPGPRRVFSASWARPRGSAALPEAGRRGEARARHGAPFVLYLRTHTHGMGYSERRGGNHVEDPVGRG